MQALTDAADAQAEHQASEEPTRQFLELLMACIVAGDAHVAAAKTGDEPEDAGRWGWRERISGADEYQYSEWQPRGKCVGWLEADGSLLLEPGSAFAAAQRMAREQGSGLPIMKRTLWKRMAEKRLLASRDSRGGRNTTRATIGGARKTVVHVIPGALLPDNGPNGPNNPPPGNGAEPGPERRVVTPPPPSETAPASGPEPADNGRPGPKGTMGPFPGPGYAEGAKQEAPHGAALPGVDGQARLVRSEADMRALIDELGGAESVALDLETTGLDPRVDRIRIVSLTTAGGTWLVDCFETDPRGLLPILADKELVAHNALFELGFLSRMGFELGPNSRVLDTMLMSQVLEDKEGS